MTQLSQTKAATEGLSPCLTPASPSVRPATLVLLYFYTLFVYFCFCDCSRKAAAVRFSPVLLPGVLQFQLPCRCRQASTSACRVIRHVCRSAHVAGWNVSVSMSQRFPTVHMYSIFSLSKHRLGVRSSGEIWSLKFAPAEFWVRTRFNQSPDKSGPTTLLRRPPPHLTTLTIPSSSLPILLIS